jgi:osmotically-inducible protein OsmY
VQGLAGAAHLHALRDQRDPGEQLEQPEQQGQADHADVRPGEEHRAEYGPDQEATAADGNLTLTGLVEYGRQGEAAELAVAGLPGVRHIRNDIDVAYDADPVDVTSLVQDALDRNALIGDDSDVTVDTKGNTVTLRGHVRTWAERDAVIGAAWMTGGVSEVRDDLVITG